MVSVRSEKTHNICTSPRLSDVSQNVAFENVLGIGLTAHSSCSSFKGTSWSASSFYVCLFQTIDGVLSLAWYPQVSRDPQHFRSSETQAICYGRLARTSLCARSVMFSSPRHVQSVCSVSDVFFTPACPVCVLGQ